MFGLVEGFNYRLRSDVWIEGEILNEESNVELYKPFSEEVKEVTDGLKKQDNICYGFPDGFYESC